MQQAVEPETTNDLYQVIDQAVVVLDPDPIANSTSGALGDFHSYVDMKDNLSYIPDAAGGHSADCLL
jgi:uncharacterized protein YfkK (UPF0435 family)